MEEDVRAGVVYRNQSPTMSKEYNTLGYGVDFSLLKNRTDNYTILGVGVNGYFDRAGTLGLTDNTFQVNMSFIQALDKRQKVYLSVGLQGGYSLRKIDASRATFEEGFNGISDFDLFIGDIPNPNLSNTHVRLGTGGLLFFNLSKKVKFHVGGGAFELARQNLSFLPGFDVRQSPRFVSNAGMEIHVKHMMIQPYFLSQFRKVEREILFGSMFLYNSHDIDSRNKGNKYMIGGGVGYRHGNAVIFSALAAYSKISITMSYDINISNQARMTNTVGGIEIGFIFKDNFASSKNRGKVLACPKIFL